MRRSRLAASPLIAVVTALVLAPAAGAAERWQPAPGGLQRPYELMSVGALDGTTVAALKSARDPSTGAYGSGGVFRFDGSAGWVREVAAPGSGQGAVAVVAGALVSVGDRDVLRHAPGEPGWTAVPGRPAAVDADAVQAAGDRVWVADSEQRVTLLDPAAGRWGARSQPLPDGATIEHLAARPGGGLLVATGFHARDGWNARRDAWLAAHPGMSAKDYLALDEAHSYPGAVYALDADRSWRDASAGLNLGNLTDGTSPGPMGVVVGGEADPLAYASTEQGAFTFDGARWTQVQAHYGNLGVLPLPGGAWASWTHSDDLVRQRGSRYRPLGAQHSDCAQDRIDGLGTADGALLVANLTRTPTGVACTRDSGVPDGLAVLRLDETLPEADRDLRVDTATYVGGPGDEQISGVALTAEGTLVAGTFDGQGRVVRLDAAGHETARAVLGGRIDDLAAPAGGDGPIAVSGDAGIAVLDGRTLAVRWQRDLGGATASRVDLAADGTAATLTNKTVRLWTATGAPAGSTAIDRDFVNDVVLDPARGHVVVGGFANRRNDGVPVQVAFVWALRTSDLTVRDWKSWDYDPDTLDADMADNRIYRLALGLDGGLYAAGESAGGNTAFRWDAQGLSRQTLQTTDIYDTAVNAGSAHMGFVGRLDPVTGAALAGKLIIPRIPGKGNISNTFRVRDGALAADEQGRIHLAGTSAFGIQGRDLASVNGERVAPYAGGDPALVVLSPDLRTRERWQSVIRTGAKGAGTAIAAGGGRFALGVTQEQGGSITRADAAQPQPADPAGDDGRRDAWVAAGPLVARDDPAATGPSPGTPPGVGAGGVPTTRPVRQRLQILRVQRRGGRRLAITLRVPVPGSLRIDVQRRAPRHWRAGTRTVRAVQRTGTVRLVVRGPRGKARLRVRALLRPTAPRAKALVARRAVPRARH